MVPGGGLGGAGLVETLPEGMKGDPASAAELGLSQAATAVIIEQGIPALVGFGRGHLDGP